MDTKKFVTFLSLSRPSQDDETVARDGEVVHIPIKLPEELDHTASSEFPGET